MVSLDLVIAAIALMGVSGLPGCLLPSRSGAGKVVAGASNLVGGLVGLVGLALALGQAETPALRLEWILPWGAFAIALDPLSTFFLAPVFVVPALGSIYGLGYLKSSEHGMGSRRLDLFYGLLAGSMALVVIARDGVLFLIAWEVMATSAFFAATIDEDDPEVRRAGWIYLIATHIGSLCLFAMFALWCDASGSFALEAADSFSAEAGPVIFALAVAGFGFKAGLMPLHVWLPGAHANAPSQVSALMSGVMLKLGIYGILRMTALLPGIEPWMGGSLLTIGAITGLAGIAFALGQSDLKRLLAYSSIENVGIIAMGIGLALLGRSLGRWDWVLLGLGGALLHVWNHGLFKSLLFFGAGAILKSTGTRDLDRLGGLARRMPVLALLFLVGALAICALPPLNGFASEWLLYIGLFRTLGLGGGTEVAVVAAAAVALAMIGAFAIACFVRLYGSVFLGSPRGPEAELAREAPTTMLGPMVALARGCLFVGLFPAVVLPPVEAAIRLWSAPMGNPTFSIADLAPLGWMTPTGLGLMALIVVLVLATRLLRRRGAVVARATWDCGYALPTSRMQYTAGSLSQAIVRLMGFMLWPVRVAPRINGPFPSASRFEGEVPDAVLDRLVLPLFGSAARLLPRVRVMQRGRTHLYLLYVLAITIVLLLLGGLGVSS